MVGTQAVPDGSGQEVVLWMVDVIMADVFDRYWIDKASRSVLQVGEGEDLIILVRE